MRRHSVALVLALVAALLAVLPAQAATRPEPTFVLTVIQNNDGESKLLEQTFSGSSFGGVARFATLVDQLRAAGQAGQRDDRRTNVRRGSIVLNSGDLILAGPQLNASFDKGVPFYDSIAVDLIGYDAMSLGNHEFDFGPGVTADLLRGFSSRPPVVASNVDFGGEPALRELVRRGRISTSAVVRVRGEKIGVVAALTPLLPAITSPGGVVVDPDVAGAVQAEVDALAAAGVTKIILLSHLQGIVEERELVAAIRGVDIVVTGGGQELLADPAEGDLLIPGDTPVGSFPQLAPDADGKSIPIVTTSGEYKYVGQLVVTFDAAGQVVDIDEAKSGPKRVSSIAPDAVAPDPELQAQVVDPVNAYVAVLQANVIATTEVPLEGRRGNTPIAPNLVGTPGVRRTETNLGSLFADSLLWKATALAPGLGVDTPQVAIQNGGGIRNNSLIPVGNITEFDTFSIAAFSNFLVVVEDIPTDQLKEILENAVSRMPAADGRFAQVAGLDFTYDITRTAQVVDNAGTVLTPGDRIRRIELDDGTVLVDVGAVQPGAPSVDIATIDFSARGGDQYPFRGAPFERLGTTTYQQALFDYITQLPTLGGPLPVIAAADYPAGGEGRISCFDGNGVGTAPDCPA